MATQLTLTDLPRSPEPYSPAHLRLLADEALADYYFEDLDIDPDLECSTTRAVVAEVERRGLTTKTLYEAMKRNMGG